MAIVHAKGSHELHAVVPAALDPDLDRLQPSLASTGHFYARPPPVLRVVTEILAVVAFENGQTRHEDVLRVDVDAVGGEMIHLSIEVFLRGIVGNKLDGTGGIVVVENPEFVARHC